MLIMHKNITNVYFLKEITNPNQNFSKLTFSELL